MWFSLALAKIEKSKTQYNTAEHLSHFISYFLEIEIYFMYLHEGDACSNVHVNVKKWFNEKHWKIWRSINFSCVFHVRLGLMCNVHHHLRAIFSERILKKTCRVLENRNECNKCITYTHALAETPQYAMQSKFMCVCVHARRWIANVKYVYKCVSLFLVNVQFCF